MFKYSLSFFKTLTSDLCWGVPASKSLFPLNHFSILMYVARLAVFTVIQLYGNLLSMDVRIKTTILLDKTLKKLAQVYAVQHDMTLQALIEKALKKEILDK